MNELVFEKQDKPMTDSLKVAQGFKKRHSDILRTLKEITAAESGVSEEFSQRNFTPSKRRDERGKYQPIYNITYDGFMLLVMGFTGKRAMKMKEAYINDFNLMRDFITVRLGAKDEFKELSEAIKQSHEELHSWFFSNEYDLINRIALGMSTKQFKREHGLNQDEPSIRPFLTKEQLRHITKLEKFDAGLVATMPEYEDRKQILSKYYGRIRQQALRG